MNRKFLFLLLTVFLALGVWILSSRDKGGGEARSDSRILSEETKESRGGVTQFAGTREPFEAVRDVNTRALVFDALASDTTLSRPLVPIGETSAEEDAALSRALEAFRLVARSGDLSALEAFLRAYPNGARSHAVRNNLAELYYSFGEFSKSYALWEEAWEKSSQLEDDLGRRLADEAFAGYSRLTILFGRKEDITPLLESVEGRPMTGAADEYRRLAFEALESMEKWEEQAFKCGPFALFRVRFHEGMDEPLHPMIEAEESTLQGTNMARLAELSEELDMPMKVVRDVDHEAIPTPSVVHWKLGHYSAVIGRDADGKYIVEDTTFANPIHITPEVMAQESSGFYLVQEEQLDQGLMTLASNEEASGLWGRMSPPGRDVEDLGSDSPDPSCGMATWSIGKLNINLRVIDTPMSYLSPVGPQVGFTMVYNARDVSQPALPNFSNLGSQWSTGWIQYIEDDPAQPLANVLRKRMSGGREKYSNYDDQTGFYDLQSRSVTRLEKVADGHYVLHHTDGSQDVFDTSDGTLVGTRRIFLTKQVDPHGNELSYTYDAQLKLTKLTDAVGKETTLQYGDLNNPYRITSVTDPYGRSATLTYDSSGLLASITDTIGITSSFTYDSGDEMISLNTPYGETTFDHSGSYTFERSLIITDPMGERQQYKFRDYYGTGTEIPDSPSAAETVSPEISVDMNGYSNRTTYHWDRKAMKYHEGDYSKSDHYHWNNTYESSYIVSGVLKAFRQPGRRLVFFRYPGQYSNEAAGTLDRPSVVAVRLPSGVVQQVQTEYNALGMVTKRIDPLGRETVIEYAANGFSVDKIKQKNGAGYDTLFEVLSRNAADQPLQVKDAAGQTTTFTYNSRGQLLTQTDALGRSSSIAYQENASAAGYARPTITTGYVAGDVTTATYDAYDRIASVTGPDNDTFNLTYDAFDRITQIDFPDGTSESHEYQWLDLVKSIDREGKTSEVGYDAIRKVQWQRDPLGSVTGFEWCVCGHLEKLTDANGNVTEWHWGLNGENLSKTLADGRTYTMTYNEVGQQVTSTDPLGQVTNFTYYTDGALASTTFTNAVHPTTGATYTYDAVYPRVTQTSGAYGSTNYTYHPNDGSTFGAGLLASQDGPWANDTTTLTYDAIGRLLSTTLQGSGTSLTYDTQGRIDTLTDVLGTTTYGYDGVTGRVLTETRPDGLSSTYTYGPVNEGSRLASITHAHSIAGQISKFSYGYSPTGQITTWTRELRPGASEQEYAFGYDEAGQLTSATLTDTATSQILENFGYRYDPGGNRLTYQRGTSVIQSTFDDTNRLTSRSAGGTVMIKGQLNQPATSITIDGQEATQNGSNGFVGEASVQTGLNRIPLNVTETDGTVTSKFVELNVDSADPLVQFYDANGNLLGVAPAATPTLALRSYEWDALNRLIAINQYAVAGDVTPEYRSEFGYNERSERVEQKEYENGVLQEHVRFLWRGHRMHQKRDAIGDTVLITYEESGEVDYGLNGTGPGLVSHYFRDHLGSVRNVLDNAGGELVSYDYTPFGQREELYRTSSIGYADYHLTFGYTGHRHHEASGLIFTKYRAYDGASGRWLSTDPIAENGGINLYGYVENSPVNFIDPLGLDMIDLGGNFTLSSWITTPIKYVTDRIGISDPNAPAPTGFSIGVLFEFPGFVPGNDKNLLGLGMDFGGYGSVHFNGTTAKMPSFSAGLGKVSFDAAYRLGGIEDLDGYALQGALQAGKHGAKIDLNIEEDGSICAGGSGIGYSLGPGIYAGAHPTKTGTVRASDDTNFFFQTLVNMGLPLFPF